MKSVIVTLCVWILCVVVVRGSSKSTEVRDRVRYVKDDGVDKIVHEERNIQVDIISNSRDVINKEDQTAASDQRQVDLDNVKTNVDAIKEIQLTNNETKEEFIKSTIDSNTNTHDGTSEDKSTGVPVFITDDGKTIQLPQSDVLYNPKTGEILIRNREHHVDSTVTAESKGIDIFNVQQPDSLGIKNLKGFVIDEDNMNKKVLYPVTVSSVDGVDLKNIPNVATTTVVDSPKDTTMKIPTTALIMNNTEVTEEAASKSKSFGTTESNQSITNTKGMPDEALVDLAIAENISISSKMAIQPSIEPDPNSENEEVQNTKIEITMPLFKNSKSAMARSNEKPFDTKESHEKMDKENTTKEHSEDEPIYKYPIGEEIQQETTGEKHSNIEEEPEESIEKAIKSVEYDPHLFQVPETPIIDESEIAKIKNTPISTDIETTKSSVTIITAEEPSDIVDQNNIVRAKMMNIDEVDSKLGEEIISDTEQKYVVSTTTEKLEPIDALRNFLEDIFLRGPIAILVDVEPRNLIRTRELWTSMESKAGNLDIEDVVLLGYDIDGITAMSYHKGSRQRGTDDGDTKSLTKALYGMTSTSKYYSGPGNPRMALNKAIQLLPYDSAIFIFEADNSDGNSNGGVGGGAPAPVPGKLIKQLITKRIKIYCISSGQAWAGGAAVTSGGSNIYLDAAPHSSSSPSLEHSPSSLQLQHNLQHHIFHQAHPHSPHYREMRALTVYYDMDDDDELVYDEQQTLVLVHNTTGIQPITIQLDSGIRVLTINITGHPTMATLRGPHGSEINLLDAASVSNFTVGSKRLSSAGYTCAVLNMAKKTVGELLVDEEEEEMVGRESSEYQGTWKVHLQSEQPVDVQVTADTNLRIMAKILKADSVTGHSEASNSLKIAVGGAVSSIRETEIVDVHGNPLGKLLYSRGHEDSTESDTTEIESLRALESGTVVEQMKIPEDLKPKDMFRVRVEGRNDRDEQFVRISSIITIPDDHKIFATNIDGPVELFNSSLINGTNANLEMTSGEVGYDHIDGGRAFNGSLNEHQQAIGSTSLEVQPMTIIQIGAASKLYGAPGTVLQVHFEVTNRRENAVFFRFGARDDKYFLRSLTPQTQWINAGQTTNVVLTVGIPTRAENNIRDTITFTANGLEPMAISLYVYVETDGTISSDRARPVLRHEFIGECLGYLREDNCRQRFWGLDITARDTDSGVMRISATPGLVYYQSNFFAGTRGETRARFTSNCCTQQVIVAATDVAGNMASYEVNVAQYFTPATIAAIVLGVILAIILIIVIVLLIRLCIKRRKVSRDLPSYSTQRAA